MPDFLVSRTELVTRTWVVTADTKEEALKDYTLKKASTTSYGGPSTVVARPVGGS